MGGHIIFNVDSPRTKSLFDFPPSPAVSPPPSRPTYRPTSPSPPSSPAGHSPERAYFASLSSIDDVPVGMLSTLLQDYHALLAENQRLQAAFLSSQLRSLSPREQLD